MYNSESVNMFIRCLIDSEELMSTTVLHAVYSFCLLQWTIPLNSVIKWLFFLIFLDIQVFVGSMKVLEKFLWGSWKVLEKSWIFFQ